MSADELEARVAKLERRVSWMMGLAIALVSICLIALSLLGSSYSLHLQGHSAALARDLEKAGRDAGK